MAGHSQFKNIMHRKGRQDAQRSRLFGKLAREITVAAKLGAPDPAMNARLRAAVLAARAENMTKDTIERAIKKSAGAEGADFAEIRYEGYGPGGVAVIVECLTDNRNRTAGEVRSIFAKAGGNLAETGAVSFQFDRVGRIAFAASVGTEDAVMEAAIEDGAEDAVSGEEEHEVYCAADDLAAVSKALEARFGEPRASALVWRARVTVPVDEEGAGRVLTLIERLEDNDDVQSVTTNADVPEAVMARLAAA